MNKEIAERIEMIKQKKIPQGLKKHTRDILPIDWKTVTVNEVMNIKNTFRIPISENERKKIQGNYPYYGPTKIQDYIDRYTLEGEHVLIGEDGDHFLKYKEKEMTLLVDGKFNVNNHAHILQGTSSCDTKWFYYNFQHKNILDSVTRQGVGRYKLTKEALQNIEFSLPRIEEQKEIINVILCWDKSIELKEELLQEKQKQKKGLMERLLSGKVRLSGFNKTWNKVKLNRILKVRNEKSEVTKELELYSLTIEDGVTPKSDRYNREFLVKEDDKKYKITKYNDIVYNPANLRYGAIALNKIEKDVLLSPIYETLYIQDNNKYDIDFIASILTSERQIRKFSTMAEGTLVERMAVKIKDFIGFHINIPNDINEQKAIAKIINTSQKEIELLKEEIEELKEQKKGLMQLLLTGIVRVKCD